MSDYVLIESRDPFDSADTGFVADTAEALRARGRDVTVYLVQNAVLATRAGARGSQVPRLAKAGVTVLADDFSLRERGIEAGEIAGGVRPASIDALVDLVMRPGAKTLWH
ncbi:MAG: DsrE family protein [Candidatus Rokubacteria bacterium]|nr:DsrE family protein [Candidatus Rokubacteria bacterium]